MEKEELIELLTRLGGSGNISKLKILDQPEELVLSHLCAVKAEGEILVNGKRAKIQIQLDTKFPFGLPYFYLSPWNALGVLPHVGHSGEICFTSTEEVVIDIRRPYDILEEGLKRATTVLSEGMAGTNKWDFIDEFDSYWAQVKGAERIDSYIEPNGDLRKIVAARATINNGKEDFVFVADDDLAYSLFQNSNSRDKFTHLAALYIPLPSGTIIEPFDKDGLDVNSIRNKIVHCLSAGAHKKLRKLTKKYRFEELVIFRLNRSKEGVNLFGILFRGVHNQHPLMKGGRADEIIPLVVKRLDKLFLLPRGGANLALQKKKILLIGCGAIGGNLAFHLIQSGILNLTLVDNQDLYPENLFRHRLGRNYIYKPKSETLKEEIRRNFPYVNINALKLPFEEVLEKELINLKDFDLVIMATGNDVSSLSMNKTLFAKKTPPILYVWLEPYGIGGHVLLTKNGEPDGCFQCLFTPVLSEERMTFQNRASFVAPGQVFTKDMAGCANRFMPYSSLDSDTTAILATRITGQLLQGRIEGNRLFSWKGNNIDLEAAGFKVSERYNGIDLNALEHGVNFHAPQCLVCGRH